MQNEKDTKDFDGWNKKKKNIDAKIPNKSWAKKGEVWWCDLGVNVGHEQDGGKNFERPVFILEQHANYTCAVLPMTKSIRDNKFSLNLRSDGYSSSVLLDQIRLISNKRLSRKIRGQNMAVFRKVICAFKKAHNFLNCLQ